MVDPEKLTRSRVLMVVYFTFVLNIKRSVLLVKKIFDAKFIKTSQTTFTPFYYMDTL